LWRPACGLKSFFHFLPTIRLGFWPILCEREIGRLLPHLASTFLIWSLSKKNAVVFIYKTDSSGVFIPCCICKMQNEQTLCRLQQSLQPVLDFAVGVVPCRIPGILSPFLILPPSTVALLLEFPVLKLVSIRRRPWSFAAPHLPGGSQRTTELDSGPNGSTAPFLRAGGVPCSRRRFLPAAELPPLFPDELPARDGGAAAWPPGATH
jgi:hypothetical protein